MDYGITILGLCPVPAYFTAIGIDIKTQGAFLSLNRVPLHWPDFTQYDLEQWRFRRTSLAPGHWGAQFY